MVWLKKIQQWPVRRKKIFIFTILIIFAIFLFRFYLINIQKKIQAFEGEKMKQSIQEGLGNEFYKARESLKEWEEELKKLYENLKKDEKGERKIE